MAKILELYLIKNNCIIENSSDRKVMFVGNRDNNVYTIDSKDCPTNNECLPTLHDNSWLDIED